MILVDCLCTLSRFDKLTEAGQSPPFNWFRTLLGGQSLKTMKTCVTLTQRSKSYSVTKVSCCGAECDVDIFLCPLKGSRLQQMK